MARRFSNLFRPAGAGPRRGLPRPAGVPPFADGSEEGTLLACAPWRVEVSALLGEHGAAVRQMDPGTGTVLGNMPQVLSYLALVQAALAVGQGAG